MFDNSILFDKETHTYYNDAGEIYEGTGCFINKFKEKFDRENISKAVAQKEGRTQKEVLDEWDSKCDRSLDYGNTIHSIIEDILKYGKYPPEGHKMYDIAGQVVSVLAEYKRVFSETIVGNHAYKRAGTVDVLGQRDTENIVIDIIDIKTNKEKGICFDSAKRRKGSEFISFVGKLEKHYNRYYYEPIDHIEDSNYNHYSLQLSDYAYLIESGYGYKIGTLAIWFFYYSDSLKQMCLRRYPVPYMKYEIEQMYKYKGLKS